MKLIKKTEGWYNLYDGEIGIGSTHKELQGFKLSLKNCESIELGYDLGELAENHWDENNRLFNDGINPYAHRFGFKAGFQKCLELMGDKKFSINEVVELTKILISNPFERCGKTYQELTDSYIQSLQQTEWDVEIIEFTADDLKSINNEWYMLGEPKLEDGYIILKRI